MGLRVDERKVRLFMADRGIKTIEELCERSGVTSLTIRRLFRGAGFKSDTVQRLADALECNPLDLLTVDGQPAPHVGAPALASVR